MTGDHTTYLDEVGAYLLGALSDAERTSFEAHLAGCAECRDELERLRPAAELLPRSVEQVEPPPSLKRSLMEVVEHEARESAGNGVVNARKAGRPLGERLRGLLSPIRPAMAAGVLALGLLVGYGVAQLGGDEGGRTAVASVNENVLPDASGSLAIQDGGKEGAILKVHGMPSLRPGLVYQAWVERDGIVEPEPTFEAGGDGGGAVAVPDDLSDADAVHLTREPRGGSRAPSEKPILTVRL
ncbi:MAG: anti-sigma factor [Thermoleophilaceae bacterium]|nr:anti-sigma factor [Thermoleophilaceae bacterium]